MSTGFSRALAPQEFMGSMQAQIQEFMGSMQAQTTQDNSSNLRLASADRLNPGSFKRPPEEMGMREIKKGHWILAGEKDDFPLSATRKDTGQFVWRSTVPVSNSDVEKIVDVAEKYGQSVHINTGTHGNPKGATVAEYDHFAECKFTVEDFGTAVKAKQVSLHILSSEAPAIYPEKANQVVDAWCYSSATENHKRPVASLIGRCSVCQEQQSVPIEPTHESYINVIKLKYTNSRKCSVHGHPETKYTELEVYKHRHVVVYMESTSSKEIRKEDSSGTEIKSYDISRSFKYYNLTI